MTIFSIHFRLFPFQQLLNKKRNICLLISFLILGTVFGQVDTLKIGKLQFAISGNTYSFFQTINSSTWNRSIYIYPKKVVYKNLPSRQMPQGRFQAFQLFRDVTRVSTVTPIEGRLQGNCRAKVWLAHTDSIDFTNIFSWSEATRVFRPFLVFDNDIKAITDSTSGWKTFGITPHFPIDTAKNLFVMVEYVQDTPALNQIFWAYDSTSVLPNDRDTINYFNRLQFRYTHYPYTRSPSPTDSFTGSNIRHPSLRLIVGTTNNIIEKNNIIEECKIFPNPITPTELRAEISLSEPTTATLRLIDNLGRVVQTEKQPLLRGGQIVIIRLLNNLPSGIYYLSIETEKNNLTRQFIKN